MKTLDPTFQNTITQKVTTIAWCWLIERLDGVKLGFTSFDLPLPIGGISYEPTTGFAPSADSTSEGFEQNDSQSLAGILSSDQISDRDLLAHKYHYAKITCFQCDVTDLPASLADLPPKYLEVYQGFLGKVTQSDRGFSIEVRKIDYLLETEIGKTTSKKCGHQLGDSNCKINLSNYTQNSAISSINSNFDFIINGNYADGIFNRGWIKFTAGANAGLTRDISYNNGGQIVTFQPFPHQINIGDSVEVVQGCDKTLYTCVTKFQNLVNGDHEPHIPTTDQAQNNPGAS